MTINIAGLDKAAVLAALYNGSSQRGMGYLHTRGLDPMSIYGAQRELDANPSFYFDYLHGRVMKVDLAGDVLDYYLYNRDNGPNAAYEAISSLLEKKKDLVSQLKPPSEEEADVSFISSIGLTIPSASEVPQLEGGGGSSGGAGASGSWDAPESPSDSGQTDVSVDSSEE